MGETSPKCACFYYLCKDNESRAQNKMNLFIFYAETHLILATLWQSNESRAQNKMNLFIFYAETHLIFATLYNNLF